MVMKNLNDFIKKNVRGFIRHAMVISSGTMFGLNLHSVEEQHTIMYILP